MLTVKASVELESADVNLSHANNNLKWTQKLFIICITLLRDYETKTVVAMFWRQVIPRMRAESRVTVIWWPLLSTNCSKVNRNKDIIKIFRSLT